MTIQSSNFPTIKPALTLDFANSKRLDPRIAFARGSQGTYVDSDGLLKTAASGVARFDHDPTTGESLGLLVEESRTNLLLRSEGFDQVTSWALSDASVASNAGVAPDGLQTADKLVENAAVSIGHFVRPTPSPTLTAGQSYTYSIFAKAAERTFLQLIFTNIGPGGANIVAGFDLTAGTAGTPINGSSLITPFGNGWYRCSLSTTASTTAASLAQIRLSLNSSPDPSSYTGDGTSGIYIWGAQLEAGSFPTSYIPTTTSAVTRAADVVSIGGSNFSSWYRQDEGTMFASYQFPAGSAVNTNSRTLVDVSDGSTDNRFNIRGIGLASPSDQITVRSNAFTVAQFSTNGTAVGAALRAIAAVYRLDDYAAVATGSSSVITDTSGALPVGVNQVIIGGTVNGTEYLSGHIHRLVYFPTRLPNSTLQALTL